MILLDANILLYAYDQSSPDHRVAVAWFENAMSSKETVAIPWPSVVAFLRIATHDRVFDQPLTTDEAVQHVESWMRRSNVVVPHPGEDHWTLLKQRVVDDQARGALVPDAHLAALSMELGAVLATTDRDFFRFEGVSLLNPLDAS